MKSVSYALKWQNLTSCVETSTLNHSTESSFSVILVRVWCGSGPWVPNRLLEYNFLDSGLFLD